MSSPLIQSLEQTENVGQRLREQAERQPGALAFTHRGQELTFAELAERAHTRAAALQSRGVAPGEHVAIVMTPGLPLIECVWATQLIGAAPCVLNPAVPPALLAGRVELVRPRIVVSDDVAGELEREGGSVTPVDVGPEDLAFLQHTSGTTGAPRVSMIRNDQLLAYARSCVVDPWIREDEIMVCWAPPWHDLGLVLFLLSAVIHGTPCHLVDPSLRTIPEWLRTISDVRGTFTGAPDFAWRLATRMVDPASVDLTSVRYGMSGGEPVRWATIEAFEQRFGVPGAITPGYGLGECVVGVSGTIPGTPRRVDARGNVASGKVMRGLEVRAGSSVDAPEEIRVRGGWVFAGYLDAPEETAQVLRDGWLHTGDSGYIDDQGYLFVLGRRRGMIKRAGALIAPRELEEAAQIVPDVRIVAAVSVPDRAGGDDLIVVAAEAETSEGRTAQDIARDVTGQVVAAVGFAPGKVEILGRGEIPRTENGKIRHDALRKMLAATAN